MSGQALLNQLLDNSVELIDNTLPQVRLLFQEALQRHNLLGLRLFLNEVLKKQEVVSVQGDDHLGSLRIITLAIHVLNDFAGELMCDQLLH